MSSAKPYPAVSIPRRLLPALLLSLAVGSCVSIAMARQRRPQLRTVRGVVVNGAGLPLNSAIVYLKNMKTMAIRTYISPSDGRYRFSGLDPNVDYEIHAEHDNLTSASHTISNFDSDMDIVIQLKVDHKKSSR